MTVRYSIVTPTIVRPELKRLCDTVDSQVEKSYEHVLVVDFDPETINPMQRDLLWRVTCSNVRRKLEWCGKRHTHGCGNTCRHWVWEKLRGEYVFYIDDDDFFLDSTVLGALNNVKKDWALFPILRHGKPFFYNPPTPCWVTTGQFLIKKEFAQWPDIPQYESDAAIVERLKAEHPDYEVLPDRMLVSSPVSSFGR